MILAGDEKLPRSFTVSQAAKLIGMTAGGLRGAILRGKLPASRDASGRLTVFSHSLAAYHLCGDATHYPEDKLGPRTRVALHDYLETVTRQPPPSGGLKEKDANQIRRDQTVD